LDEVDVFWAASAGLGSILRPPQLAAFHFGASGGGNDRPNRADRNDGHLVAKLPHVAAFFRHRFCLPKFVGWFRSIE
jgi:hypothetical protein